MACIRKRRGKWIIDYRDSTGRRRWITSRNKREAEDILAQKVQEARQATVPLVDPTITVQAYSLRWLGLTEQTVEARTLEDYRTRLDRYVLPVFGPVKVRALSRGRIKQFLADKLSQGLSWNTVRLILAPLRGMLNAAVDDGILLSNPAARLGRQLRLSRPAAESAEEIKAMDREQLSRFLATASRVEPRHYPLLLVLARTGLRLGEALALQWDDIDFNRHVIRVERALSSGKVKTPKTRRSRQVDMSQQLAEVLLTYYARVKESALRDC